MDELFKTFINTIIQELAKRLLNAKKKRINEPFCKRNINTMAHDKTIEISSPFVVSERLKYIIKLMAETDKFNLRFSVSRIAENLGLETATELYDYINSKKEPTFEFLEKFCNLYTVNPEWVKHGAGQPFAIMESWGIYPEEYYEKFIELNPECIYFVRDNSEKGKVIVIIEINDPRYLIIRKVYHISSDVGGTGEAQIYVFYKLFRKVKQDRRLYNKCEGVILNEEIFNDISTGRIYPGYLKQPHVNRNSWWDDFTDINHYFPISASYEHWYGKEFIKAQEIVLSKIKERIDIA